MTATELTSTALAAEEAAQAATSTMLQATPQTDGPHSDTETENVDGVAQEILNDVIDNGGVKKKDATNLLSCVIDPIVGAWNGTILPTIRKVIDLARKYLCCCCFSAKAKEASSVEVKIEEGVELTPEQAFLINEEQRSHDKSVCSTVGSAGPIKAKVGLDTGTLRRNIALPIYELVTYDTTYFDHNFIVGAKTVPSRDSITQQLSKVDVSSAYKAFGKLNQTTARQIFINVYNLDEDADIEDDGAGGDTFATSVKDNFNLFTQYFPKMRKAIALCFRENSQMISNLRESLKETTNALKENSGAPFKEGDS